MRTLDLRHLLVFVCLVAAAPGSGLEAEPASHSLDLVPCRLSTPRGLSSVAARCGNIDVPTDPAAADHEFISLRVALIEAVNPSENSTPLTLLAGGPGQAATDFYAAYAPVFDRIRRRHDIFLVDQRGTGASNALQCDQPEEFGAAITLDSVRDATSECLAGLESDPRFFTTSLAVRDLDVVRAAFGYDEINLYGASYGTRVALHYLRRYPERTRAVILDGVVPADHAIGSDMSVNAQRALDLMFVRCQESEECNATFPDLEQAFDDLVGRLRSEPQIVDLQHPVTGERTSIHFSDLELGLAVRLLSYSPQSLALLPLLIDQAWRADNLLPLAAQAVMESEATADALSIGMHNSIVCSEDVPFLDRDHIDNRAVEATYLGRIPLDALIETCKLWPAGPVDADFKAPVVSDRPVLILSGSADPITPPSQGERVASTLEIVRHIIGTDQGHGLLAVGCVPKLMAKFIDTANPKDLAPDCVADARPAPFFVSFAGPAP